MRHWSQLATKNWSARPIRTLGAVLAIALGVGAVVWVTCTFESVRVTVFNWAQTYVGNSQISVESPLGKYGTIPQSLLPRIEKLAQVQSTAPMLIQRLPGLPVAAEKVGQAAKRGNAWSGDVPELDLWGIDANREGAVRTWNIEPGQGRMLTPADANECVLEAAYAEAYGVGVGDKVLVWGVSQPEPFELDVVGLVERRRIARFQKGLVLLPLRTLQMIASQPQGLTTIDIVLKDPSTDAISSTRAAVVGVVRTHRFGANANVKTTLARMKQIKAAQTQQEVVLQLLALVAMLTALFIILSTLSMGMIERITQLGLMRCVGVTGRQLAWLVLAEVAPLGVFGVLAGVPIGFALSQLSVWLAPDYVGSFTISWRGVALAVGAGLVTTVVAAILPMFAALRVSPLEATHPRARRARLMPVIWTAVFGLAVLGGQWWLMEYWVLRSPQFAEMASVAVISLYLAYACIAPLAVWLIARPAVAIAARLLAMQTRLLQDQVGHAVWRSTGIACGLMVGLSLIVGLVVFSESFQGGWQFPKQFTEAYIWSFDQMRPIANDVDERIAEVAHVKEFTSCNAINVHVEEKPMFMQEVFASVTWFMGCDPAVFFDLIRVEFLDGDKEEAIRLMQAGPPAEFEPNEPAYQGYIVVAEDFARSRNKGRGDVVKVYYANRLYRFKIAAVVSSPALDIAAGYFQANTEMRVVASGSVLGTNADMEKILDVRGRKLVLLNIDPPDAPVPDDWPPPKDSVEGRQLGVRFYDQDVPRERRWQRYQQTLVLDEVRRKLKAPQAFYGTVAELKAEIDRELTRMTRLLTLVPAVALLVAALGVANLMTANVAARIKQLATLRAVGATRGLVLRMVIGEAVVLGLVGGALGVGLGLHLAWNTTRLTERMWGMDVGLALPWGFVLFAAGLTIGLCIIAGVLPARSAARTNVVEALHVT